MLKQGDDERHEYYQQLYSKKQALNRALHVDDATRLAIKNHRIAWANVLWKLDHLFNKGYDFPSQIKEAERWARGNSCAKKVTIKRRRV
jgi:hypothetical protein